MTVSADGRSVELYRSMRRFPRQWWKAEAVAKRKAAPWQPKITEPGEVKPRRDTLFGLTELSELRGGTAEHTPGREDTGQGGGERATRVGW